MSALDSLPRPSAARLAVRVTPDAYRQVRAGHPWLFEGSIRSVNREGAPGDLAVVFDEDRQFVAIGLWDPASPIRIKVLHQGKPVTIDAAWFHDAMAAALAKRQPLIETAGTQNATTGYRIIHGENDGFPGLVVDRYGDVAVLKLYSAAWIPHLPTVVAALHALLAPRSLVLRLARALKDQPLHGLAEGMSLIGPDVTEPVLFLEHGLTFEADVIHGQKTGYFLDQRDNRLRVAQLSEGQRVLDLFSCSGGFSVHAASGGAHLVHSVDSAPGAIQAAERNMVRNRDNPKVAAAPHQTTIGEAFATMEKLIEARKHFGVVIIDPPSFARNAASVQRAITAYQRLTTLGLQLVEREGILIQASCSSRVGEADFVRAVYAAAAQGGFDLEEEGRTGHAIDHPIGFAEGAYLKAIYARPERRPGRR